MGLQAVLSVVLLLGFYVMMLAFAGAFMAASVAIVLFMPSFRSLIVAVILFIPGCLLLLGVFSVRRPAFVAPGRLLSREDAPGLFAALDELGSRVGTAPPAEVYLSPLPTLAVAEVGGFLGGRRLLILGAPLLRLLTARELRAGLAHELGHFAGGDTRTCGIVAYTRASFAAVHRSVQRDPFRAGTSHYAVEGGFALAQAVGQSLVELYARLYFRIIHSLGRRQELVADDVAMRLVGGEATARGLEKFAAAAPLFRHYLNTDVGFAVLKGAMPTDFWAGFERCRDRLLATDAGKAFLAQLPKEEPDPYDTHPPLGDRLSRLRADRAGDGQEDGGFPASRLLSASFDLDEWMREAILERILAAASADGRRVGVVHRMPWARIASDVLAPWARESARLAAEALFPLFPDASTVPAMFESFLRGAKDGRFGEIVLRLNPAIARAHPGDAHAMAGDVFCEAGTALFQGALLERGALLDEALGTSCLVFVLGDETVPAAQIVQAALATPEGREALERWAEHLAH
jgi:Zn-dependent protease with chaperone function